MVAEAGRLGAGAHPGQSLREHDGQPEGGEQSTAFPVVLPLPPFVSSDRVCHRGLSFKLSKALPFRADFQGEVTHVIIDTAAGPEQVRLVAPKGLFRLVIRSKSASTKAFYEWAEKLVTTTRVERKGRRRAVIGVPTVRSSRQQLWRVYLL